VLTLPKVVNLKILKARKMKILDKKFEKALPRYIKT